MRVGGLSALRPGRFWDGPVILCGHSMGGLLAAEAATHTHPAARRVFALVAYDVPLLGMHPHVVMTGLASLVPKKKKDGEAGEEGSEEGLKTEREMNDARHVDIPHTRRTVAPEPSSIPPPLPPRPSSHNQLSTTSSTNTNATTSSRPNTPQAPFPAILSRTLHFLQSHADDPLVTFLAEHRAEPLTAARRWVVESFEFGACMFDPKGLRARYAALVAWKGEWVAFWTETEPPQVLLERRSEVEAAEDKEQQMKEDAEGEEHATASLGRLLEVDASVHSSASISSYSSTPSSSTTDITHPSSSDLSPPPSPRPFDPKVASKANKEHAKAIKAQQKQHAKALKVKQKEHAKELKTLRKQHNIHSPHHFVVRPAGSQRWERVAVRGAKDEVEAHCGLFLRRLNWDYEVFVGRVAEVVERWIPRLGEEAGS
ncbi:hypothetical protein K439DRAFT_1623720 [Ramaria rubella]|nr:hypothetical protein K439DRAFT_1623720 [Ramaria rubella]